MLYRILTQMDDCDAMIIWEGESRKEAEAVYEENRGTCRYIYGSDRISNVNLHYNYTDCCIEQDEDGICDILQSWRTVRIYESGPFAMDDEDEDYQQRLRDYQGEVDDIRKKTSADEIIK